MIKGIFFDVHGTLIDKGGSQGIEKGMDNIVAFLNSNGISVTKKIYKEAWLSNLKKHRSDYEELNEVSFYDWYGGILDDMGISNPTEIFMDKLNEVWMRGFVETTAEIPPAKDVLSKLRPYYRLGIISNSMGRNTELDLNRTDLREFFEVLIISSELGKRKPHTRIFKAGLDDMGLRPEEVVMVGDDLIEDILGAKKVGMRAVWLDQKDSLKSYSQQRKPHPFSHESRNRLEDKNEALKFADGVLKSLEGLESLISTW